MNSKIDPRGASWQLEASFLRPSGVESHATLAQALLASRTMPLTTYHSITTSLAG